MFSNKSLGAKVSGNLPMAGVGREGDIALTTRQFRADGWSPKKPVLIIPGEFPAAAAVLGWRTYLTQLA